MADEQGSGLRLERQGPVALIVLDNAAQMNPLRIEMQQALRDCLAELSRDRGVRALLLTGEGRGFCVGADMSLLASASEEAGSLGGRIAEAMHMLSNRLILDLRSLPFPVVCAVNGACAGAGVGLALAADIVLAARSAYFYLPFMPRLGILPDLGTTWFSERFVGRARATGMALLNERLPAERAAAWGLIWACVDDEALRAEALAIAQRLAALPAHGAPEVRAALDAAGSHSLAQQLEYETGRQRELLDLPSLAEGVAAFRGRREPQFAPR